MQKVKIGKLYIVATPIGNLQDITLRAIETLKNVDRIAAEDTRHTGPLLKHFSIEKPIVSLHEFNERERSQTLLDFIQRGESVALISDAGTPLISDPGFRLVREAQTLGVEVISVPGACAAIAALSIAGLPTDRFVFEGFLPAKKEANRHHLASLRHEQRTMIFYESPKRLINTLQNMSAILGADRKAVVARELTKLYETVVASDLHHLIEHYDLHPDQLRGEIVILVAGVKSTGMSTTEIIPEEVLDILCAELPLKQACSLASKITGIRKNVLYELALSKK